ncbi:hypothetical protein SVIO_100060 [Streptomyces violaceusniger]|uniref:WCX domain-containing protein n=1 Tax=Streptomyces violaceusniger TaxID=68280 RepID=A0A4D4LMT8_STRVO|nr:hypothetical protein SVIO_100060 [Streptomyces violaceusniger]
MRTFRLDRIETASVLPGSFDVPEGFDPAARVLSGLAGVPYPHEVSLRVRGTVEQVRHRLPPGLATVRELPAGPVRDTASREGEGSAWVRVELRAERLEWVPSVLAWLDLPFVIEHPEALRDHVRALAGRLATCAEAVADATEGAEPRAE